MVTNKDFYSKQYEKFHGEGLAACQDNKWPLALVKQMDQNTDSEEQSYYNYPLVRYPQARGSRTLGEMNTYYFRFNETQRFYFEVGSNFIANNAVLQLRTTYGPNEGITYTGKQIGNLNIIDLDVSPGDYSLVLSQFSGSDNFCGMYSLKGILNLYSTQA